MLIWNKEKAKTKWNKNLAASYINTQLKMCIFNSTKNEFMTSKAFQKNDIVIIIININCCYIILLFITITLLHYCYYC